ncbi:MAG: hypothetical protein KAJ18_12335 [Candidatus Omnitrophica bacterium]|nr:hypothetical protein [Candidatus Omnitrophota bacterium]
MSPTPEERDEMAAQNAKKSDDRLDAVEEEMKAHVDAVEEEMKAHIDVINEGEKVGEPVDRDQTQETIPRLRAISFEISSDELNGEPGASIEKIEEVIQGTDTGPKDPVSSYGRPGWDPGGQEILERAKVRIEALFEIATEVGDVEAEILQEELEVLELLVERGKEILE